ncbi:hypothetical protein A9Q79_06540 [Methylophaga sp. 42_25_T18]|nr:hypothetical protein A9Q79_06540 [Methylophaga sp. 42_25_T18]OUR89112.1 hypothetical protein A9Q92_01555 [Methylophaga sp. 42_8_T64]
MAIKHGLVIATCLTLLSTANISLACDTIFFDECLDGVGPAVTNSDNLRTASYRITNTIRNRDSSEEDITTSQLNGVTGRAAGDHFGNWSVWGNVSSTAYDADIPLTNALDGLGNPVPLASYEGDLDSVLIGTDTLIGNQFLVGVAFSYEENDIFTDYNGGDNESDGFTVSPYAAYLFNDIFSIDVSAGYSSLDYDTDRIDNTNGNTIRGNFDADRWFVASNINAIINRGNWYFAGRIGYLYTEEEQDGYTETGGPTARTLPDRHIDLSQIIVGFDVAYSFGWYEPYVIVTYLNDINADDGSSAGGLPGNTATAVNDDDEVQTGIGLRLFDNDVSGTLEWSRVIGRDTFDSDTLMFTLRANI